jgi:hypothetical protein
MPASAKIAAIFAAASPTVSCNLEAADLAPGAAWRGDPLGQRWISELGPGITSPQGYVRLLGQGGDFAAPFWSMATARTSPLIFACRTARRAASSQPML